MSKAVNSPTARLLQSSRLFSLPRPLPPPDLSGGTSTSIYRSSETATTPYPTHQAIATPASSLHRGDWGLKRSLPGKKLRGTKPTVRIRAQDTWEHVTTFESAGDHVRTLEKWNEMGVPMMVKQQDGTFKGPGMVRGRQTPVSVYDEGQDLTDKARDSEYTRRWKYDGPWLAGMQEGEFQNWLLHQVGGRKGEWEKFLREKWVEDKLAEATKVARNQGIVLTAKGIQRIRKRHWLSDEKLREHQKDLRDTNVSGEFSSTLTKYMTEFLDLPGGPSDASSRGNGIVSAAGLTSDRGPPSTHPGAGLSHLRTTAIMENHPIHGPQAMRTPVQARVIQHRVSGGLVKEQRARLGVAGVVADDSMSSTFKSEDKSRFKQNTNDVTQQMDPELVGGSKVWVRPDGAWIDENGMVRLDLSRAEHESIAVKTGEGIEEIHEAKRLDDGMRGASGNGGLGVPRGNFGTALPNMKRLAEQQQARRQQGDPARVAAGGRQRSRVEGFDKELGENAKASGPEGVAEILKRGI